MAVADIKCEVEEQLYPDEPEVVQSIIAEKDDTEFKPDKFETVKDDKETSTISLMMQLSSLPIKDELDIQHGGSSKETSGDEDPNNVTGDGNSYVVIDQDNHTEDEEPPKKKFKENLPSAVVPKYSSGDASLNEKECPLSKESHKLEDKTYDMPISSPSGMIEFNIVDDLESNDNDNYNDNEDNSSSDSSNISINELDMLLDESFQSKKRVREPLHEEKKKIILKVRGRDHFDVLPEGWIEVTHNSGMPIYLHKSTRVCTVSKPYFLGPGSTRKHELPISAIPCLQYLKELEKEAKEKEKKKEGAKDNSDSVKDSLPSAKLQTFKDTKESGSLDYMAVRDYCKKRFEFQTITIKRFKTWSGRRMHQKQLRKKQRPTLPDNTKLITCPLPVAADKNSASTTNPKREFIMNPSGKSPICILHEYVQHTLKVQPRYIFKELENAKTPYGASVMINEIEYGYGYGSSKKQAKGEAAKAALEVLFPKMKLFEREKKSEEEQDVEFFDEVRVEDPRINELSNKAGQPYPYEILLECLKRNFGMGDTEIYFSMRNLKHQKNELNMTVGKHSVSVVCRNKRDGKHRAAQAVLQLLHPHITCWGSLLRMYGKGSCKTLKEKKEEEQKITELQNEACANKPNMSILNKLKEEMMKYAEKMKTRKPVGKLVPEHVEITASNSTLKNVEL